MRTHSLSLSLFLPFCLSVCLSLSSVSYLLVSSSLSQFPFPSLPLSFSLTLPLLSLPSTDHDSTVITSQCVSGQSHTALSSHLPLSCRPANRGRPSRWTAVTTPPPPPSGVNTDHCHLNLGQWYSAAKRTAHIRHCGFVPSDRRITRATKMERGETKR